MSFEPTGTMVYTERQSTAKIADQNGQLLVPRMDKFPILPDVGHVTDITSDGNGVEVDTRIARNSTLIRNMLDDLGEIEGHNIPLTGIDDVGVLKNAMVYAEHLMDSDTNAEGSIRWCREFFEGLSSDELLDLINAANYIEFSALYQSACRAASQRLVGKSAQEIRQILRLQEP